MMCPYWCGSTFHDRSETSTALAELRLASGTVARNGPSPHPPRKVGVHLHRQIQFAAVQFRSRMQRGVPACNFFAGGRFSGMQAGRLRYMQITNYFAIKLTILPGT
jgi:hypothetical protein